MKPLLLLLSLFFGLALADVFRRKGCARGMKGGEIRNVPECDISDTFCRVKFGTQRLMGVGSEALFEGLVYTCNKEEHEYRTQVIGCVSQYGNFLKIGENATEGYIASGVYNSLCLPMDGGAKLEIEQISDLTPGAQPRQKRYQRLRVPRCDANTRNGETYYNGNLIYTCKIDYRGRNKSSVFACIKRQHRDETHILLGQSAVVDGRKMRCRVTKGGKAVLELVEGALELAKTGRTKSTDKCEEGYKLGETWIEGKFVLACKLVEGDRGTSAEGWTFTVPIVIQCITYKGHKIPVGEMKRYDDGSAAECVRFGLKEARLAMLPPIAVDTVPPPSTTTTGTCENGKKAGQVMIEEGVHYICEADNTGKLRFVAKGCWYMHQYAGKLRLALGATVNQGFETLTCKPIKGGRAKLERVENKVEQKCDNGRKLREEWLEEIFIKACVQDTNWVDGFEGIVVVKACYINGVTIPIGEEREGVPEQGTCNCSRVNKPNPNSFGFDPVLKAEYSCWSDYPSAQGIIIRHPTAPKA